MAYLELRCENGHTVAGSSDGHIMVYRTCQDCEDPDDPGEMHVTVSVRDELIPLEKLLRRASDALTDALQVCKVVVAEGGHVDDSTIGLAARVLARTRPTTADWTLPGEHPCRCCGGDPVLWCTACEVRCSSQTCACLCEGGKGPERVVWAKHVAEVGIS